ncbi:LANO_0H04632g1_1 [Lachancea nothofagi CBS 11611]|uniref:LANO_0H04632g1_1 n=1 Tax=Lachancea nothofagi CBS 11611 TaxID=1266666 RepID=A0A1G4KLE8_9SACH|nr:LANO_0H04632g1_1 [Lachancea nothofagi CBS 11611]
MHPQQQQQQSAQQLYGYPDLVRKPGPDFVPALNANDLMMAPQMTASYNTSSMGQQLPHQLPRSNDAGIASISQHSQVQGQRGQARKQPQSQPPLQQQGQGQAPNLPPNDLSNSASAIPSPFTTSIPTPTGSASMPAMNLQGLAPGLGPGQLSNGMRSSGLGTIPMSTSGNNISMHAVPETAPMATSTSGPGVLPSSPYGATTGPQPFLSVPAIPQPQVRRYVPSNTIPYPIRKYLSNMAILRLHEIINLINVSTGIVDDFEYWKRFTNDLFTPYGILRYSTKGGEETRQFEFTTPIIPLICQSLGSVGVVRLEIVPQQLRAQVLSNGTIFFDCPRCTTTYYYPDGSYMTNFSQIKGIFDSNLKMVWVEISSYSFVPGIEWSSLERLISSEPICHEIFQDLSQPPKKSEKQDDTLNPPSVEDDQDPQMPSNFSAITKLRAQFGVFHNISSFGVQESFMRALQVNDVISYLKNLKVYQKVNNYRSPLGSLEALVASSQAEKTAAVPPGAPTKYGNNVFSPAPASSTSRTRTSYSSRPHSKKRRQSDLSPLSTGVKNSTPKQDPSEGSSGDSFKKVKF